VFRSYWRFLVVIWHLLPLILAYARDRRRFLLFGGTRDVSAEQRRKRARSLLNSLVTLGPTFVKLGQLLSTRPDVLPPEYIAEFSKLQDRVPPADWKEAKVVVEEELGAVDEQFEDFNTSAISGASLGQVYKASIDGEPVAVKVRRPGVEKLVAADLRVIRWSLPLLMYFVDDARSFSLETLADEFDKRIRQEMDYEREASMLREIRANFEHTDGIRMPHVIESHSTRRVLTMEYVGGTKITDTEALAGKNIDLTELADRLQRTYLQMIVEDGVFHGDPHPGNLAVADDGTLIFYDFGMSGYVDPFIQDKIVAFYTAIARRDIEAILDTLIEIGTLSPDADREVMGEIMELAIADLSGEDIEQYRVQQIVQQVEDTIYEFPLRLPANLALVLRVATVVEGVCVTLDADFDFIAVATDFLRTEGYVEEGIREYIGDRRDEIRDAAGASVRVPPKLESVLDRMDRDDLQVDATIRDSDKHFRRLGKRLVLGMLFAAGIVSTTMLFVLSTPLATAVGGGVTVFVGILLYRSFQSGIGIYTEPQFTRQRMRERESEESGAAIGFGDELIEEESDEGEPAIEQPIPEADDEGEASEDAQTAPEEQEMVDAAVDSTDDDATSIAVRDESSEADAVEIEPETPDSDMAEADRQSAGEEYTEDDPENDEDQGE
jgi:predicted unusual protein kinase regulating ubiquinone biosynthesis (AarF/ABC1/UbiB family)